MLSLEKRRPILAVIAVLLLLVMVACSRVVSVTINEGNQTLEVDETKQLTVNVIVEGNASTRVEWASRTPGVASVTDDGLVTALSPGTTEVTATSVADGSKSDTITVTVLETVGDPDPMIRIEKSTNGEAAGIPPGPVLNVGAPVTWTYEVENTGDVTLTDVLVTDDQIGPIACPQNALEPAARMTCSASGTAEAGQYANLGTVTATTPGGDTVTDSDPSHYFGAQDIVGDPDPSISIEKATNGVDADTPTGPILEEGDPVTWTFSVENTGNVTLTDVVVTDDRLGPIACPKDTLRPAERMTCSAAGIAAVGQYRNVGSVRGTTPWDQTVTDSDPSHYLVEDEEEEEVQGRWGASFGDPHLRTMDGRVYTFQAVGDYVLSRSTQSDDDFEVQVRYIPMEPRQSWSANGAVAAMVEGDQVEVHLGAAGYEIFVNEARELGPFPHRLPGGGSVVTSPNLVTVSWPDGTTLTARLRPYDIGSVQLFLPEARAGLVEGLLGDFDGDRTNDLRIRGGEVVTDDSERNLYDGGFRDSWSVAHGASPSLFSHGADPFDPDYPRHINILEDFEASEIAAARQTCIDRGVADQALLDTCTLDLLVSGDDSWADVTAAIDPNTATIVVLPPVAWVHTGGEREFQAVVWGTDDGGVTWSLDGAGELVSDGDRATFEAPESPGMATITAALVATPGVTAEATVVVIDAPAVPAGVVATVDTIRGRVEDPLGFGAFAVGLYPQTGEPGEERRLASGTVDAAGELSVPLPVLDAGQVAGAEREPFWWCGQNYEFVVGAFIVSDAAMNWGGIPMRVAYLRLRYPTEVIAWSMVVYLYSLETRDVTCASDADATLAAVDVRIRPGWNVLAHYMTYAGGFWRTGDPDLDVPWMGPYPVDAW